MASAGFSSQPPSAPTLLACLPVTLALGLEPEDVGDLVLADGHARDTIPALVELKVGSAFLFRVLARCILGRKDKDLWQGLLDRLGVAPESLVLACINRPEAAALGRVLAAYPGWKGIEIGPGFADPSGPPTYEVRLGPGCRPRHLICPESFNLVDMDLSTWCPEELAARSKLGFKGCRGPFKVGHLKVPNLDLDADLDLEVGSGDPMLEHIQRRLGKDLRVSCRPEPGAFRWRGGAYAPEPPPALLCLDHWSKGRFRPLGDVPPGAQVGLLGSGRRSGRSLGLPKAVPWSLTLMQLSRLRRLPAEFSFAPLGEGPHTGQTLDIVLCPHFEVLPEGLAFPGSLFLSSLASLRQLPRHLDVERHLIMKELEALVRIRTGLRVGSEGEVSGAPRLHAWEGPAQVEGSLRLERCASLRALPDALRVGGDLILDDLPALEGLPPSLRVEGTLRIKGCRPLPLPPGAWVGKGIILS